MAAEVEIPAGFVPQYALAFGAVDAPAVSVHAGAVELRRSLDGGATQLPLTAGGERWGRFTGNANEAVTDESEAGASYHLGVTLQSGTLAYRVAQ
jgi:hypothetical protein